MKIYENGGTETTRIGYVNRNHQICTGHRNVRGTDHEQLSYRLLCLGLPLPHRSQLPPGPLLEQEAIAHRMQECIAVPHDLVSRGRVAGAAEVAAEPCYEKHGATKVGGPGNALFFA